MSQTSEGVKNVVLVHGGFVDGSGWQGVYDLLKKDGYNVSIVQNPTTSLADDVAVTKRTLAAQNGPAILVGHSYGGVVITEAGNDPKVAGLVYIAAFAPDKGESVSALIKNPPPGAPVLRSCRRRTAISSSTGRSSASRSRRTSPRTPPRSWPTPKCRGARGAQRCGHRTGVEDEAKLYLVATDDRMIPPDAQRAMSKRAGSTVVEAKGSHAVYVSQPQAVATIIAKATQGVAVVIQDGEVFAHEAGLL